MSFSLVYLANRFVFRAWEFIRDWYAGGFLGITGRTYDFLGSLDRTFALNVTLRHFGEPLYGDRSAIGYILGFIFRSFRVVIAIVLYVIIAIIGISLYILWALLPLFIIYLGIT